MHYDGCESCPLKPSLCHGVADGFGLDGCIAFDHKRCAEWGWTCVCNPHLFAERYREVGGFACQLQRPLRPIEFKIPHYVPTLYNGFKYTRPLDMGWIAIPLHVLFRS